MMEKFFLSRKSRSKADVDKPTQKRPLKLGKKIDEWGLPNSVVNAFITNSMEEMFDWQCECLQTGNVLKGENLIYTAPTSAGKSFVADILMMKRFYDTGKKCILIQPYIAVVREKIMSLSSLLKHENVKVDGYMGSQPTASRFMDIDIAVCSIEKANNLINKIVMDGDIDKIGIIVVDEIHMICDESRGYLIELLLSKIMFFNRKKDCNIQIVGMSATLNNPQHLAQWLEANVYVTQFRPIPLMERIIFEKQVYNVDKDNMEVLECRKLSLSDLIFSKDYKNSKNDLLASLKEEDLYTIILETIFLDGGLLMFCPLKTWCESLCVEFSAFLQHILNLYKNNPSHFNIPNMEKIVNILTNSKLSELVSKFKNLDTEIDKNLIKCLEFGVTFHHAGLTVEERDLIETSFKCGIIKLITCTSTLSAGVNLPARRVIIKTPIFYKNCLKYLVYQQMSGRSGRKGLDTCGESILMCKDEKEYKIGCQLTLSCLTDVNSAVFLINTDNKKINPFLAKIILELIVAKIATTVNDIELYLKGMFVNGTVESFINESCYIVMGYLIDKNFISMNEEKQVQYSLLANAAVSSGLGPDESLDVFSNLCSARKNFCIENELHLVFLITPRNIVYSWKNINWQRMYTIWQQLPNDLNNVSKILNIKEYYLLKLANKCSVSIKIVNSYKRFFISLAMMDILCEKSLYQVSKKFEINRGILQSLQNQTSVFAGMITIFCNRLKWNRLELLLSDFQRRLRSGVGPELADIIRIALLDKDKARAIYDAGYKTVAMIYVGCNVKNMSQILANVKEFNAKPEDEKKDIYGSSLNGGVVQLTCSEAAKLIVKEAKEILYSDFREMGLEMNLDTKNEMNMFFDDKINVSCTSNDMQVLNSQIQLYTQPKPKKLKSDINVEMSDCVLNDELVTDENIGDNVTENFSIYSWGDDSNLNSIGSGDTSDDFSKISHLSYSDLDVSEAKFDAYKRTTDDVMDAVIDTPELIDINDSHVSNLLDDLKRSSPSNNDENMNGSNAMSSTLLSISNISNDEKVSVGGNSDISSNVSFFSMSTTASSNNVEYTKLKAKSRCTSKVELVDGNFTNVTDDYDSTMFNLQSKWTDETHFTTKLKHAYIDGHWNLKHTPLNNININNINFKKMSPQHNIILNKFRMQLLESLVISIHCTTTIDSTHNQVYNIAATQTVKKKEKSHGFKTVSIQTSLDNREIYNFSMDFTLSKGMTTWTNFTDFLIDIFSNIDKKKFLIIADFMLFLSIVVKFPVDGNFIIHCLKTVTWLFDTGSQVVSFNDVGSRLISNALFDHMVSLYPPSQLVFYLFINATKKSLLRQSIISLEMGVLSVFDKIQKFGITISMSNLRGLRSILMDLREKLTCSATKLAGTVFNMNSHKDVAEILYNKLKLDKNIYSSLVEVTSNPAVQIEVQLKAKINNGKWIISTKKKNLSVLKKFHPLPNIISTYRWVNDVIEKYIVPIREIFINSQQTDKCNDDTSDEMSDYAKLYIAYNLQNCSGRTTLKEPNFQNLPKKNTIEFLNVDDKLISIECCPRKIVSCSSDEVLVSFDYKQLELRILAHFCQDENLLKGINCGMEIFKSLACLMFKMCVDKVGEKERNNAKMMCYAMIYGCGSKTLSQMLCCSEPEGEELISQFNASYPKIDIYRKQIIKTVSDNDGMVESLAGRLIIIKNYSSNNINLKQSAERKIFNCKIQSSASDIVKIAMLEIDKLQTSSFNAILQIHDELLFQIKKTNMNETIHQIKQAMEGCIKLNNINLVVKVRTGTDWGNLVDFDLEL